jgi:hypothetical protein
MMRHKFFFSFGFLFLAILITAGSCGTTPPTPKAILSNLSPNPLTLPTVNVGQTASGTFSFENTGDATLNYTIGYSPTPESGSLEAGQQSENFDASFDCKNVGTYTASLEITSNGGDKTLDIKGECKEKPVSTGNFDIDIRFVGNTTTDEQKDIFAQAELTWEAIINGDLLDAQWDSVDQTQLNDCEPDAPNIVGETIDDLVIFAKVGPIDGIDGTLAQAGPLALRQDATLLPYGGCMAFDEADINSLVQDGSFADVILHEMGHVLGIGTLWNSGLRNLGSPPCTRGGGDVSYTGSKGILEFAALGGTGNPLIEGSTNLRGSDCGHWNEGTFDNELMTFRIEGSGTRNPLSKLTIASLDDLGYAVDYNLAASYDLPDGLGGCSPNCAVVETQSNDEHWEIVIQPAVRPQPKEMLKSFSKKQ